MTFTKKQQEIILLMLENKGYRLNPNGQKLYKSRAFYSIINDLIKCGLIRSFKKENDGSSYQLTDKGVMFGKIIKDKVDNTDLITIEDLIRFFIVKE